MTFATVTENAVRLEPTGPDPFLEGEDAFASAPREMDGASPARLRRMAGADPDHSRSARSSSRSRTTSKPRAR